MPNSSLPLVLLVAGGTGGHVYPALALAEEMKKRGLKTAWIGTRRGLEVKVAEEAKIPLHQLPTIGLRGKPFVVKIFAVLIMLQALVRAIFLIWRLRPSCVVGMGGYASVPGCLAAWLLRKPLLIHEQNAIAGTANRFLIPFASKVISGFPGVFKPNVNAVVLGNPVRKEFLESPKTNIFNYTSNRKLKLLILGGSLGARRLNEIAVSAINGFEQIYENRLEVRHQCGFDHLDEVYRNYQNLDRKEINVVPFIKDMVEAYIWSDLILCRAGALTISELALTSSPALLVPLPNSIDDHQKANGNVLVECGSAKMLDQADLSGSKLRHLLKSLMEDPLALKGMAKAASSVAKPLATKDFCNLCMEYINRA